MKNRILTICMGLLTIGAIFLALSSCGIMNKDRAILEIDIQDPIGAKMILPSGDIDFDYYIVAITHQVTANEMSQQVSAPPAPVTFANIEAGDYDIMVTGFNALDELLGSGTGTVSVLANDTSNANVQVNYETGTGTLEVDYTLTPDDLVYAPGIEGELWDQTSWAPVTVVQDAPGAWSYDTTLSAGFYAHRFELHSYGDTDVHIAGGMEAVFIMTGRNTPGSYDFNAVNLTPPTTGSTIIIIWEPQDMPFNVVFTDGITQVDTDEVYTLQASADVTVAPGDWMWFEDGEIIPGEINSDIVLTAPAETKVNNFSVLAKAGGALSSAQKIITAVVPPPTFTSITWFAPLFIPSEAGTTSYTLDVFDENVDPLPDGQTVYLQIDSTSDADFLTYVTVDATAIVASGQITFDLVNSTNLGTNDVVGRIEACNDATFTTVLTSPDITYGNY